MNGSNSTLRSVRRDACARTARLIAALALSTALSPLAAAPVSGQRSYPSAEAAVQALFDAVVSGDRRELRPLFGADTPRIAPIADDASMRSVRDLFVDAWSRGSAIETVSADRARLLLGADRWPYPVPVSRGADGRWSWDTRAGLQEVDVRRIGRNEITAMQALRAYADAQNEYARVDRNGDGVAEYAQRIDSTPGRRDGLHWATAAGEPESPLGPAAAEAARRGQAGTPYRGYVFRVLTGQGPAARGGAFDYRVGGRMTRGFAGIATPAQYGRSGVHTFVINHDGRVYSRDLGPDTRSRAARIQRFDPSEGWKREQ
jgi:hypothetical protein